MITSRSALAAVLIGFFSAQLVLADNPANLQELIDRAAPGSEVTIPKGKWDQPLNVTKPLKLRGEDRDGCVIDVTSDKPAIRFEHKEQGSLENVTVRWRLATSNRSSEPQAAIVVKDTPLTLRNVRVIAPDSFARCPGALHGLGFCEIKADGCHFEGFEFALEFGKGAKADIIDCVVAKPGHCGITAGEDSIVHVARTIVTGSRYHGIRNTGGELNAEHNLVIANKNRGIYIGNKPARGVIHDNMIQHNGSGISAFAESEVKVHHNLIQGNEYAGIDMRDTCRLSVEHNLLLNNGKALVLFKESGTDRSTFGPNASAGNKVETEGFDKPPELQKFEAEPAQDAIAKAKAAGFGLADPEPLKGVWQRWTEMQEEPR